MHLLPALCRDARHDHARLHTASSGKRRAQLFNDGQGRVVCAVRHEDNLVGRIVLIEERAEIVAQTLIESATRRYDGSKGSKARLFSFQLAPHKRQKPEPAAKRFNAQPHDQQSEEIEDKHKKRDVRCQILDVRSCMKSRCHSFSSVGAEMFIAQRHQSTIKLRRSGMSWVKKKMPLRRSLIVGSACQL